MHKEVIAVHSLKKSYKPLKTEFTTEALTDL